VAVCADRQHCTSAGPRHGTRLPFLLGRFRHHTCDLSRRRLRDAPDRSSFNNSAVAAHCFAMAAHGSAYLTTLNVA
jgi:hypothetical protein